MTNNTPLKSDNAPSSIAAILTLLVVFAVLYNVLDMPREGNFFAWVVFLGCGALLVAGMAMRMLKNLRPPSS